MSKRDDSWSYYDTFKYENILCEVIGLFYVGHYEIRVETENVEIANLVFSGFATDDQKNRIAQSVELGDWLIRLANVSPTIFVSEITIAGIESLIERGMSEDDACAYSISFCFWSQYHLSFSLDIDTDSFTVADSYDWFQEIKKTVGITQPYELGMFFMYLHFCAINFRLTADHIFTVYSGEPEKVTDMFELVTSARFSASMSEHMFKCSAAALDELVKIRNSEYHSDNSSSEAIYKLFSEFPESKLSQIDSVFNKLGESNPKYSRLQTDFKDITALYGYVSDEGSDLRIIAALVVRYGEGAVLQADGLIRSARLDGKPRLETLFAVSEYLSKGGDASSPVSWIMALNGIS